MASDMGLSPIQRITFLFVYYTQFEFVQSSCSGSQILIFDKTPQHPFAGGNNACKDNEPYRGYRFVGGSLTLGWPPESQFQHDSKTKMPALPPSAIVSAIVEVPRHSAAVFSDTLGHGPEEMHFPRNQQSAP